MCARDGSNPPRAVCSSDGAFTTLAPVGERALAIADQYRGTPFVYGGASPATGFDDTGLVQYAFGQVGVTLPRVAYQQVEAGTAVALADLRRGDLVFFSTDMSGIANHAGIFEGNGMFLHGPHTGDVIKSASINDPFYMHTFLAGRRISG
jgi:cell wall-associated NlpC family hydrolase